MRLVLTREARDRLTIELPSEMGGHAARLRDSVLAAQPEIEFLVSGGYVDLDLTFVDMELGDDLRKQPKVTDLRGDDAH